MNTSAKSTSQYSGRERRAFPRVNCRAYATLLSKNTCWDVHLVDLSFNGALVALIKEHQLKSGEAVILDIEQEEGPSIKMQGKLAHTNAHLLGLECRASGIDQQSRLRELLRRHQQTSKQQNRTVETMFDEYHGDTNE